MYKSVIAGYSRSPFTMAKKGGLIDVKPVNLLDEVIKNLVSKSKINPNDIEDIVVGCAFQVGEQCFNIGKLVTFLTGHPSSSDPPKISIFDYRPLQKMECNFQNKEIFYNLMK